MRRYAFFPGCFIQVRLPHLEMVSRKVLEALGIKLVDLEGFTCCPEAVTFSIDKMSWRVVAARNLSLAEEEGLDLLTLCNGCLYTLRLVNEELKGDEEIRMRVNEALSTIDRGFKGAIKVKHVIEVLLEEISLEGLNTRVERPLTGLRVACHTGCHILSPSDKMHFDDPYDPVILEEMVKALGAEAVDYGLKSLCCGWTLPTYGSRGAAERLLGSKLESMKRSEADYIAVICPQCFHQFDVGQASAARRVGLDFRLPVFYYLQLLALAMGFSLEEVGFRHHRVKTKAVEESLGVMR